MTASSMALSRAWSGFSSAAHRAWVATASGGLKALTWLVPMLATAGVTAYLSYFYNQKANTALVVRQQQVADLQQFRLSGAQLDQGLSAMSDALVDGKGLDAARHDMRAAITRNISDAVAARHVLGSAADPYIGGLADLRVAVDNVDTIASGRDLWQKSLNLMQQRRDMISAAERRALTA